MVLWYLLCCFFTHHWKRRYFLTRSVHTHKKWTPPHFLFNTFISVVTSALCRLTHSQPIDPKLPGCPAALGPRCPSPHFSVVLRDISRAVWLKCFGEALSSLFLAQPLSEDAVTHPTEQAQLLHSTESIKCSWKYLIKMLTLQINSSVSITTLCAGQDGLHRPSQQTLLMVHGDSLCVWLKTARDKKGQPCGQTLPSGLEGWWALLTLLTLACTLPCVSGWPVQPGSALPHRCLHQPMVDHGSRPSWTGGHFLTCWWPAISWCGCSAWA